MLQIKLQTVACEFRNEIKMDKKKERKSNLTTHHKRKFHSIHWFYLEENIYMLHSIIPQDKTGDVWHDVEKIVWREPVSLGVNIHKDVPRWEHLGELNSTITREVLKIFSNIFVTVPSAV